MRTKILCLLLAVLVMACLTVVACGKGAAPSKEKPIVFGVATTLGSLHGLAGLDAAQMAVEEINAKGGVSVGGVKRPLVIKSIDTREHEPGIPVQDALAGVEKLILDEKPDAIAMGAYRSEVLVASMDLIAKYKLPYVVTIAQTPVMQQKVTESYDKYKYIFRTTTNSGHLAMYPEQAMGYMGQNFGFKKAYCIAQDVLFATATVGHMEKWLKDNGWTVTGSDKYPTGATDFSPTLMKIKESGAQVIAACFDMPEVAVLLKQAREMKIPAVFVGYYSPLSPANAWKAFNGEIEGAMHMINGPGQLPIEKIPKSVEFNKNFAKRWGEELRDKMPDNGVPHSYDSVYALAAAIERAGTLEADAVVKALEATDMEGVVGRIRFGKDHQAVYGTDPKETGVGAVIQWQAPGKRVPVFPESVAEGKIVLPPWMK